MTIKPVIKHSPGRRLVAGLALGVGLLMGSAATSAIAEEQFEWPSYFNIITPIVGTANHSLAVAWASEFSADTRSRARVLPSPNGYSRASWLETGEGRLYMVQASDYFDQMDATEGFASRTAGPADTRLLNVNMVTPWGYMVRGDSDIESIHDIGPGTRIAYTSSSSFLLAGIDALLEYLELDHDDVRLVETGNFGANTAVVVEGRADVTFTSPLSGPTYEAEAGPNSIRWLELPEEDTDPEAMARFRQIHNGYIARPAEAGVSTAHGINMDHAFQSNHVRGDEDEEFVYQLVKWMDENHSAYEDAFTHAHMMTIDNLIQFLEIGALQPLHEGTIRYLDELGHWTDEFQRRQDQLVDLAQERARLYQEALDMAAEQGIPTQSGNADWHEFWQNHRAENGHAEPFGLMVMNLD